MRKIFLFTASVAGRWVRILTGTFVLAWSFYLPEPYNWIAGVLAMVPLLAGTLDFCVFAPLFGYSFWGYRLIAKSKRTSQQTLTKL